MYRTLIVDDEQLMRQYLSSNLSELCPDFCVTGNACDGLEAVELLNRQEFDLVITDIKMPEMDGLNLSKYICDSFPSTKVIIISGYNEFEYARLAIRYGVSDYLLKPLSDDAVIETLSKVKSELEQDNAAFEIAATQEEYSGYGEQALRSALFAALLTENNPRIQQLYGIMAERGLSLLKRYSCILLLCLDELSLLLQEKKVLENTSYRLELNQQCESYCKRHEISFTFLEDYALLLLSADQEETLPSLAEHIFQDIHEQFIRREKLKLLASYGSTVTDMADLPVSYTAAVKSLSLTLLPLASPVSSCYTQNQSKFIYELNVILNALCSDFIAKNSSKLHSDLYQYVGLLHDTFHIAAILRFGTLLIRYIVKRCNIKSDYLILAFQKLTSAIDQNIGTKAFDEKEIHTLFLKTLNVLDHEHLLTLLPEPENIIKSAREYICSHYQEQISLALVAEILNVTPSYFSDLFHKSTGEPYTKFLTRIRMEQALLLLKSNPEGKIYKIAEKTGFVSVKHFNHVFKKFYGFTPTQYLMKSIKNTEYH